MRTLLIADMHLSNDTPELNQGFYRYLEHTAKGAEDLYILGDLFDAWIGDDLLDTPHPLSGVAHEVISSRSLFQRVSPVSLFKAMMKDCPS